MSKVLTSPYYYVNMIGGTSRIINHLLNHCSYLDRGDAVRLSIVSDRNHTSIVYVRDNENVIDCNTYIKDILLQQDESISR